MTTKKSSKKASRKKPAAGKLAKAENIKLLKDKAEVKTTKEKGILEPYSLEKEKEVRKFWEKDGIPNKARTQHKDSEKHFYFMDGPPYATGHIHMGTALNKILKDFAMRYWRMKGHDVFDRPGYDTHGLPIEHKIETQLGFKGKEDIEEYGVGKFVDKCREFATQFIGTMNNEFNDLGVWMDWENPYLTLNNEYIEAIWFAFKKAEEKKLLYLGKYPVHLCPRCETALAYNEIEYTKQTDNAVFVKFPVKGKKEEHLIIWTTTPWTLPGNTGVMVHPDYDYAFVELSNGETWIIAEKLVQKIMDTIEAGFKIQKVVKGKELEGLNYNNPLAKKLKLPELKNAYRVVLSARYVNLEEGTGLVHTAPGHGKEDFDAGQKNDLPALSPVNSDGSLTEEAGKYKGGKAREVDKEIVADLDKDGYLVFKHPYTHDYPICWRCKSPLLMLSMSQWFFKIKDIQKQLLGFNDKTNWVPGWMYDRMKNWLEQLGDWPISRDRYWGTPLPIWVCESCYERKVIGSLKELQEEAGVSENIDVHKPGIDVITIPCKCGGKMKRVPEVLDVWFDSSVSSWAALGFPQDKKLFERFWPADLNIEGTDQFRGWWNSQLISSTICFDKAPFKTIAVHGIVLAMSKKKMGLKEKMSKSIGNVVTPKEVIEKYNRDYLRSWVAANSKGEDMAFDWDYFKDINRFFNIFWNTFNFINLYLEVKPVDKITAADLKAEDKWLLSRINSLTEEAIQAYEGYNYPKAMNALMNFVLDDLSRTYIKLARDRIGTESEEALKQTLNYTVFKLLKLLAPLTPHISEYIYQNMRTIDVPESVHLNAFPEADKKMVDKDLELAMEQVKALTQTALSLREELKLRLRWPLKGVVIQAKKAGKLTELTEVLAKMCNTHAATVQEKEPVGNFAIKEWKDLKVFLNADTDKELQEEWELRELVRRIQSMRKDKKLNPNDIVGLHLDCSDKAFLEKHKAQIEKLTNSWITVTKGKMEKLLEKSFFIELKK